MVIVTMDLVNVMKDLKEMIAQVFLVLQKDAKNPVFLNAYNFAHMFIKQRDL